MSFFLSSKLFGKKAKAQPIVNKESPVFSQNDPKLDGMKVGTVKQMIDAAEYNKNDFLLAEWFVARPKLHDLMVFYFMKAQDVSHLGLYRNFAIKSQIVQLFKLIRKLENSITELRSAAYSNDDLDPFKEIERLQEAKQFMTLIRVNDSLSEKYNRRVRQRLAEVLTEKKLCAASLLSMLTANDVLANNIIPVVRFDVLSQGNDEIISLDPECQENMKRVNAFKRMNSPLYKKLSEISFRFVASVDPEVDVISDHLDFLISRYCNGIDGKYSVLPESCDAVEFLDFLKHPLSKFTEIANYLNNPCIDTYNALLKKLLKYFGSRKEEVVTLCWNSVAPLCAPSLKFDGKGSENVDAYLEFIHFIAIYDPALLLSRIVDVEEFVAMFSMFSSSYRDLLNYAVQFTETETLREDLSSMREKVITYLAVTD